MSDQRWYDTLTARLGYVDGPMLMYAKGGAAWMGARYTLESQSGYASADGGVNGIAFFHNTRSGWTVGGGIEYLLSPTWSAKAEYAFLDFGAQTVGTNCLVPGTSLIATSRGFMSSRPA